MLRAKNTHKGLEPKEAERGAYNECIEGVVHLELASDELPVYPKGLDGKQASEVDVVRWVARNISNPKPRVKDCPDFFAWTLLLQCRKDPAFIGWFTEKLWAKLIPTRANLGDIAGDGEIDGAATIGIIGKIMKIREKVTGGGVNQMEDSLTHAQEVAGSNPAPATSPEGVA